MSFGGQLYHGGHHGLDVWSYIARLGVSMKGAGDDFFAEGDAVCAKDNKIMTKSFVGTDVGV